MSGLKQKTITIEKEGRDKGKVFLIKEMDAVSFFDWSDEAVGAIDYGGDRFSLLKDLGLTREMIDLTGTEVSIVALIGVVKVLQSIDERKRKDLRERLLDCCYICHNGDESVMRSFSKWLPGDVMEPTTILTLFIESFNLHTNFFKIAGQ